MKVVYLEKTDIHSTLTTWLYCHFHMAYVADKMLGASAYFHWPKFLSLQCFSDEDQFRKQPNMFDWYFEQPFINMNPNDRQYYDVWTWEKEKWGANVHENYTSKGLMNQPLEIIKSYFKNHLLFNDETNRRGNLLVEKYGIDFTKTIGITWRGTDIYLDGRPRMPIETYYRFIDDILEKNPDYHIACTAEETGILDPLFARYPNTFLIEEFTQAPIGAKDNPEKLRSHLSGYERGLVPVLMVWLFSKCAWYIKNRSSTGAVASWMSTGNIISLGHPENLGYEPCGDYYEINAVRHTPLYQ
jgi:hypothetical protein